MNKNIFEGFIDRYNLGGEIESVLITSNDDGLAVRTISADKTLMGSVSVEGVDFPDGEFGIYTTSQLKGLLSVLDSTVEVEATDSSLKFFDKGTEVNYMLAMPSVIPTTPSLKQLPDFDVEVSLTDEFTSKFIKSRNVLSEAETFTFVRKNNKSQIILGYSSTNSNRIYIDVDAGDGDDIPHISFSSKHLKAILTANKGSNTSVLNISKAGLSHISIKDDEFTCDYYLVEVK